jgi:hypothetical protein
MQGMPTLKFSPKYYLIAMQDFEIRFIDWNAATLARWIESAGSLINLET